MSWCYLGFPSIRGGVKKNTRYHSIQYCYIFPCFDLILFPIIVLKVIKYSTASCLWLNWIIICYVIFSCSYSTFSRKHSTRMASINQMVSWVYLYFFLLQLLSPSSSYFWEKLELPSWSIPNCLHWNQIPLRSSGKHSWIHSNEAMCFCYIKIRVRVYVCSYKSNTFDVNLVIWRTSNV